MAFPKLLKRGARWFKDKLPNAAAETVELRAEGVSIEQLEAIPGRHDFAQYIIEEAAGTADVFDWIVAEQDLVLPGKGKRQPADGWEIWYRQENGEVAVFVVRASEGTRAFDVVDQYGILYRIHTKFERRE